MLPTAIKAALDRMSSEWNHSMKHVHFMKAQTVLSSARDKPCGVSTKATFEQDVMHVPAVGQQDLRPFV